MKNKVLLQSFLSDIEAVIFPRLCTACNNRLNKHEDLICLDCANNLPQTHFHKDKDNPVAKIFWGRVPLENAAAFLFFSKKGKVQNMLHHLKYKGTKEVGVLLGKIYGASLIKEHAFKDVDFIVPVPLHPDKLKKRGYNQSEVIAAGMAISMGVPLNTSIFERTVFTETQTKKSRYKRWENVSNIFSVTNPVPFENKHILLVDDVITTGATIEACAHEIRKIKNCRLSVVAIATAMSL